LPLACILFLDNSRRREYNIAIMKNSKNINRNKGMPKGIPVRVSITSQIRDLTPDEDDMDMPPGFDGEEQAPDVEVIEYKTDGVLSDDGETVSLTYSEVEELGFEQSSTKLSCSRKKPGTVTMVRTGSGATACRFSEDERRQHCIYNTGYMPIELIINTHTVENEYKNQSGRIALDYTVELRGLTTERNRLEIDYKPIAERASELSDAPPEL